MHTATGADRRHEPPADEAAGRHDDRLAGRRRVLFVADMELWPLHSGIHQRLHRLATGLTHDYDVTLLMLSHYDRTTFPGSERFEAVHVVPYDSCWFGRPDHVQAGEVVRALATIRARSPELVRGWHSQRLADLIADLHHDRPFDATWVTRAYLAEHVFAAAVEPVIVDLPDIDSMLLAQQRPPGAALARRFVHRLELEAVRRWERTVYRRAAAVVVCKPEDVAHCGRDATTAVVPNGIEVPPTVSSDGERPDEILFVGSLDWQPNIDAVTVFAERVLPIIRDVRPSVRFIAAGKLPSPEVLDLHDGDGMVVVPNPPTLDPHYRRATMAVVPMRQGSGTRLKVLEALAHGKALVSTPLGAEGVPAAPGVHYLSAQLDEEFADACLTLFADDELRRRLGAAGRCWAEANARWGPSVERAAEVIRSVLRPSASLSDGQGAGATATTAMRGADQRDPNPFAPRS